MESGLQLVATLSAGLFAGAALYITLVEHPARMQCGTGLAVTEFGPSYKRATVMQAPLAAVGFLTRTGDRLDLLATAIVGEDGWVDLGEPIIVRAGEAFVAVPRGGEDSTLPALRSP